MTTQDRPPHRSLLLGALSRDERQALLRRGRRLHVPQGGLIFAHGSPGDDALLIETGRVRITLSSTEGRQTILSNLGPGDLVGELAVLDGATRSANAEAATDVTGTVLTRAAFLDLIETRPRAAQAIITALCTRLRQTNDAFASHALTDGAVRLARVLLRLFDGWSRPRAAGGLLLDGPFSQTEIGNMAGLTRESVNRQLRKLETRGVILREDGHLCLIDRAALAETAQLDDFAGD